MKQNLGIALIIVVCLGAWGALQLTIDETPLPPLSEASSPKERLPIHTYKDIGDDFTLVGPQGSKVQLSDYRGKYVLLTFGYTSCPDTCPVTMSQLQQVHQKLADDSKHLQVLFVTFDPVRDQPEALQSYVSYFDPSFIGLTGSVVGIKNVAHKFRTVFLKEDTGSESGYVFAHTDYVYLIDTEGRVRAMYRSTDTSETIISDIKYLLKNSEKQRGHS